MRLSGILDVYIPSAAIAELGLDFVSKIASTKHQVINALVTQLPDKQFKKRPIAN
jgi:hypothetical protein